MLLALSSRIAERVYLPQLHIPMPASTATCSTAGSCCMLASSCMLGAAKTCTSCCVTSCRQGGLHSNAAFKLPTATPPDGNAVPAKRFSCFTKARSQECRCLLPQACPSLQTCHPRLRVGRPLCPPVRAWLHSTQEASCSVASRRLPGSWSSQTASICTSERGR